VGSNYRRSREDNLKLLSTEKGWLTLKQLKRLRADTTGDLVVEAAILFPIIIMIFAALVLLAMYLPQRMILQDAAQTAAMMISTQRSDTWIAFDENANRVSRGNMPRPPNVYVDFVRNASLSRRQEDASRAESLVRAIAGRGIVSAPGHITVEFDVVNFIIYQEVIVRVAQEIPMPVNLSFIGFPSTLLLEQEARAVILDGDEFVRNINIAKDMVTWIGSRFNIDLSGALDSIFDIRGIFGF